MKKTLLFFSLLCLLLFFVFVARKALRPSYVSREEPALGTFVSITIEKTQDCEAILNGAFKKIRELETIFSVHNPESELSRLNSLKKTGVSGQLLYLIQKSLHISEITGGAFDITVLPLIHLYKQAEKEGVPPSESQIKEALAYVGWTKIEINGTTVRIPGELDMGGIAKGYIVDKTAEFLREKGVKNGLVNAGGDIYCFGKSPGGGKWRIGIQDPFQKNSIIETLNISGFAAATSGDYERYLSIKGKKYGHIINPATGKTVQDFPAGITVIAPDTATADGLATAFFVFGVAKSIEISDRMDNVDVFIIDGNGKTYQSRNFALFTLP